MDVSTSLEKRLAFSTSSGTATTYTSSAYTGITNLSQSFIASGAPVMVAIIPKTLPGVSDISQIYNTASVVTTQVQRPVIEIELRRDAVVIARVRFEAKIDGTVNTDSMSANCGCYIFGFDLPAPGSYTYAAYISVPFDGTARVDNCQLFIREL